MGPMKFSLEHHASDQAFTRSAVGQAGTIAVARAIEAAGFEAISFPEHPAPSDTWSRQPNAHPNLDPLTGMAFCAAVTTTLRLWSCMLVLPLRNPLLAAKQVATAD